jgi:alpha-tubulin suppressor-like RCC1 family protein
MKPSARSWVFLIALLTGCRDSTAPTDATTWSQFAAGGTYTCGVSRAGVPYCWGGVGGFYYPPSPSDSIIPNSALPLLVPGGHQFAWITVGDLVQCGVDDVGDAYCWGGNTRGEVGDSSTIAKRGPSRVAGGQRWSRLDAGSAHVCGIAMDGAAYCWGNNFRGALGLGGGQISGYSTHPMPVAVSAKLANIWAGSGTTCGLTASGEAYCWGINDYGMLGDSQPPAPFGENATPARVATDLRFQSLAVGTYAVCGIAADGRAYCWGYGGVLGNGTTSPSSTPTAVTGDLRWDSLSVGAGHTCGIATDSAAYCWGNGERGRFGTGDTTIWLVPRRIAEPGRYRAITAGGQHTCGLTADGTGLCWGRGDYGQLGQGFMRDELRPVLVQAH